MKPEQHPAFWNEFIPHPEDDHWGKLLQRPAYQITADDVATLYMRDERKRKAERDVKP